MIMTKFYIETVATAIKSVSFIGMVLGNDTIKIISAFALLFVNLAKVIYEYKHRIIFKNGL